MSRGRNEGIKNERADISKTESPNRCKGKTKLGAACGAAATAGGLCFFHANPNRAAELGRIGGRSNGRSHSEIGSAVPNLETAAEIDKALEQLILDVYAGRVNYKVAVALANLMNMLRTAKEASELQVRIAELGKQLADAGGRTENKPSEDKPVAGSSRRTERSFDS